MPAAKKAAAPNKITVKKSQRTRTVVPVVGVSPLLVHSWSQKGLREMFQGMRGTKVKAKDRPPKNPVEDFLGSLYTVNMADRIHALDESGAVVTDYEGELTTYLPFWAEFVDKENSGWGFPSRAFLLAAIRAGKYEGLVMTDLKCVLQIPLEFCRIESAPPQCRFDVVRVGMNKPDLRFRGEFPVGWKTKVTILHRADLISVESVVALVEAAGSIAVGEWRGEKGGIHGQFVVDPKTKIETGPFVPGSLKA